MSPLEHPNDHFFNDLSVPIGSEEPPQHSDSPDHTKDGDSTTRLKRVACLVCRKRKLRCDGIRPSCGNCSRLGHECGYSDIRRKSGPRRGYVKELEARLHQVEHQLRATDKLPKKTPSPSSIDTHFGTHNGKDNTSPGLHSNTRSHSVDQSLPDLTVTNSGQNGQGKNIPWEVIGLGLEEPLPPQDMIDDMDQIYFETVHKSIPMIHKYRYLAALNLAPASRPPVCLRYSMWTLVASVTEKYASFVDTFYRRARKYVELDEMKGHGECFVTVGHAQCWALIASFEFKTMYFPRAWMSVGRTSRLVQMLGLQRVDHEGLEVKRTLAPPRDWVEREERRRTFWMAYCNDRYASIGTGWPMTFDEQDIYTKLPASLEAFEKGIPEESVSFVDALTGDGASRLSALGAITVVASLYGQNLTHLHRTYDNDDPDDPTNGGFWKRHRHLDNMLSTITLFLPEHLKMPTSDQDPNIPFLNMALHTAVICLHQAAILKAEKHGLSDTLIKQSVTRCFHAAEEVFNVMKMISHIGMARMHPFMAFCLYVAARVLIHAYKKRRDAVEIRDKFEFLLKAMQAHMKKTPLTASFLAQLQVELEAAGLENPLADVSLQGIDHLVEKDFIAPVVPRMSQTQPSIHDVRAAQSANSRSFIRTETDPAPGEDPCTVFDLPPRLRGRVTSMSQEPGVTAPVTMGMQSSWQENAVESYSGYDTEMASGEHAGFNGHPTPTSMQHASSHTSYSPGQEKITQLHQPGSEGFLVGQGDYRSFAAAVDPSFAAVSDWGTLADPAMNPSMNDASWAQYDPMAWDPQGMSMSAPPDINMTQWRHQSQHGTSGV